MFSAHKSSTIYNSSFLYFKRYIFRKVQVGQSQRCQKVRICSKCSKSARHLLLNFESIYWSRNKNQWADTLWSMVKLVINQTECNTTIPNSLKIAIGVLIWKIRRQKVQLEDQLITLTTKISKNTIQQEIVFSQACTFF